MMVRSHISSVAGVDVLKGVLRLLLMQIYIIINFIHGVSMKRSQCLFVDVLVSVDVAHIKPVIFRTAPGDGHRLYWSTWLFHEVL